MYKDSPYKWLFFTLAIGFLCVLLHACGEIDSENYPTISIINPTTEESYFTTSSAVRIGGGATYTGSVLVRNVNTGSEVNAYVTYSQGASSWFADVRSLGFGENLIIATAEYHGTEPRFASAQITIYRPEQPALMILNGPDESSTNTFWVDAHSFNSSHKLVIFDDGTGVSTTGAALSEAAGELSFFSWELTKPDELTITDCPSCSFQKISRISGSKDEGLFYGQISSTGGEGEVVLHAFELYSGDIN